MNDHAAWTRPGVRRNFSVAAVAALLLLGACAPLPKNVVVLLDNPGGETGSVALTSGDSSAVLDTPLRAIGIAKEGNALSEQIDVDRAAAVSEFQAAFNAQPRAPEKFLLYFAPGTSLLLPESEADLPRIVSIARNRPFADVGIVGHADRVGPAGANANLSRRRAESIRETLESQGVDPAIIVVTSHGEGNPLIPTADEVAEPRNRRVEVTIR